jgi:hypothetical protein
MYNEGLTRFASEKYKLTNSKNNKFSHLTNYSINKKNSKFVQNKKLSDDDRGNKWSLSALCKHLDQIGIDSNLLWSRIYDIVIKSFISADGAICGGVKKLVHSRNNCFELFGFDILIDSDLRPWLMEVNLTPSLSTDSPVDMAVKGNLIADIFTLIGIKAFDRKKEGLYKSKNIYNPGKNSNLYKKYQSQGNFCHIYT